MKAAVEPEKRVEISAESFEGIDLQQQNDIAAVLGKQELRGVTLEMLRQETLQLTDSIAELVKRGDNGDPEGYVQASFLAGQKKQIADILHSNSVATSDFARPTAENEFSFRVPGPATDQSLEVYIRDQLKRSNHRFERIITSLKALGVDVTGAAPVLNEGVLRMDSNNMTLQEQRDFYNDVGGLADPKQAVSLAIEAVKQAAEKEISLRRIDYEPWDEKGERIYSEAIKAGLDEGTATMLKVLNAGQVRAEVVCLFVSDSGSLSVGEPHDDVDCWGLGGAAPAAEIKI